MFPHRDVIDIAKAEFRHAKRLPEEPAPGEKQLVLLVVFGAREDGVPGPTDGRFQKIGIGCRTGLLVVLTLGQRRLPIRVLELLVIDRRRG
jgi:hypothetical protein